MMKRIIQYSFFLATLSFFSCVEEIDKTYNEKTVAEFQATVVSSPAVGKTFPIINLINKDSTVNAQVNLVGVPRSTETVVNISVDKTESTAVENTHFKFPNGAKVTFPANSNIGTFSFQTLKVAAQAGASANIIFVIEQTGDVAPNENYKKIGYSIKL
jgi:hypothetical protein